MAGPAVYGVGLQAPGALSLFEMPEPKPAAGEVVVRVLAVAVCGSDLALVRGDRVAPSYPWVVGHEAVGEVVGVGAGGDPRRVGQRVVLEPNYPDLTCHACLRGRPSACPRRLSAGFSAPGYLKERVAVPDAFAWPVGDESTVEDLACVEPLSVAMAAVRRSGITSESEALILGAGAQGLLILQTLLAAGVQPVLVDPQSDRQELARTLGGSILADLDDRRRFTHVFDTTGAASALTAHLDRLLEPSDVTLVGTSPQLLGLSTHDVVRRQMCIRGSFLYEHPVDFRATIRAVQSGRLRPGDILRRRATLEGAPSAIVNAGTIAGKTWIDMR